MFAASLGALRIEAAMLPRLLAGDPSIPAGRVAAEDQLVVADRASAAEVAG